MTNREKYLRKTLLSFADIILSSDTSREPSPDIGVCSKCGWEGDVGGCEMDEEGNFEDGYYMIHLCPNCDDGGDINYKMSEERAKEWQEWRISKTSKHNRI
jgi:hypothetical protein